MLAVDLRGGQVLAHRHAVDRGGAVVVDDAGADIALRVQLIGGKGGVHRRHVGGQIAAKAVVLGQRLRVGLQIGAEPLHVGAELGGGHVLLAEPCLQLLHVPGHLLGGLDDHGPQVLELLRVLQRRFPGGGRRAAALSLPGAASSVADRAALQRRQRHVQLLGHLEQVGILLGQLLLHRPVGIGRHEKLAHGRSLPFSYTALTL